MDKINLKSICDETSKITANLIDEFLIYYAAAQSGLDKEFEKRIAIYKHMTAELDAAWVRYFKSQYITHRIFREGGLVNKYINHSQIKRRSDEEVEFLKFQKEHPWKFSYSFIYKDLGDNFFEMADVFRDETFLLYSPNVGQMIHERNYKLYYNLMGFNGGCWQSYGPILGFQSFRPDDIFFFGTEVNSKIEDDDDLISSVEENPIPYMMLVHGSQYPVIQSGDDEIIEVWGSHESPQFETAIVEKYFDIKYSEGIYEMTLKDDGKVAHLATAYYDENENEISLHAMSVKGYKTLVEKLKKCNVNVPEEPGIMVTTGMISLTSKILRKKVSLNPFRELFHSRSEDKEPLEAMNKFLQLALPYINSGKIPDIKILAKEAGIDEEEAKQLYDASMDRINKLKGNI